MTLDAELVALHFDTSHSRVKTTGRHLAAVDDFEICFGVPLCMQLAEPIKVFSRANV